MYSCSYGNNSVVLSICFSRVMVLLIRPYLCLLFKTCNAYANWGSLCFMCLVCSWYLCFKLWLICRCMTCKFIDSPLVLFSMFRKNFHFYYYVNYVVTLRCDLFITSCICYFV